MQGLLAALTTRGRAFLAAGATVLLGGMLLGLDVLLQIGVFSLALPVVALGFVGHSRSAIGVTREVSPVRVPVGGDVDVTLTLSGSGRGTSGTVLLEDRIPDSLGGNRRFSVDARGGAWQGATRYHLIPHRRGYYALGPLSVRIGDPFGFLTVARTFHTTTPLIVTPTIHPLGQLWGGGTGNEQGEHRVRLGATGRADDTSVREYHVGDDLRRIHWRTTARVGELMVRREEEGRHADLTIYLDTRRDTHRPGADGTFEWAVSAAASVAAHFVGHGWDVRLVTDGTDSHDSAADELGLILDELAAVRMSSRRRADDVPPDVLTSRGTVVALVTGADPAALDQVDRCSQGAGRRLALVLDEQGWLGRSHGASGPAADLVARARARGWSTAGVGGADSVASAWGALAQQSHKAVTR